MRASTRPFTRHTRANWAPRLLAIDRDVATRASIEEHDLTHKKGFDTPNTPDVVDAMDRYITDFDAVRKTARDTAEFIVAMRQKYPDWIGDRLLRQSSAAAYGLLTLPY